MSSSMIWNEEDVDFFLGMLIDPDDLLMEKNMLEDGFDVTDENRDDVFWENVEDTLEFTDEEVYMERGEVEEDCFLLDVSHVLELTDEEMAILLMNTKDDEEHIINLFLQSAIDRSDAHHEYDDPEMIEDILDSMDE